MITMIDSFYNVNISNGIENDSLIIHSMLGLLKNKSGIHFDALYLLVFDYNFKPVNRIQKYKKIWKRYPEFCGVKLGDEICLEFDDAILWVSCCKGDIEQMCSFLLKHPLNSLIVQSFFDLTENRNCQRLFQQLFVKGTLQGAILRIYPFTQIELCNKYATVFDLILRCGEDGEEICFSLITKE